MRQVERTCCPIHTTATPPLPLRITTHNIRYAANSHQRFRHEAPWSERILPLTQQMHFLTRSHSTPAHSLVCVQECLTVQFDYISRVLGDEWDGVGVGRDDGMAQGERCAVWWRKGMWSRKWFETVWLNEEGMVGKRGWDAASVRVVTCVVLEAVRGGEVEVDDGMSEGDVESRNGKRVLLMNTHLDDSGVVARREAAKILLRVKERLRRAWEVDVVVLAGDLNSEANGEAYQVLSASDSGLVDAKGCVSEHERYGESNTFTGFDGKGDGEELKRIDFVFVGDDGVASAEELAKGYAVLPNVFEEVRCSDHRAVVVDLVI